MLETVEELDSCFDESSSTVNYRETCVFQATHSSLIMNRITDSAERIINVEKAPKETSENCVVSKYKQSQDTTRSNSKAASFVLA